MRDAPSFNALGAGMHPVATLEKGAVAKLHLLDQDELVELSIKPSLWFIPIVAAPFGAVAGLVAAALALLTRDGGSLLAAYGVSAAILAILLRLVLASLQWASRVYILTNRRVMRVSGVASVHIADCHLTRVARAEVRADPAQRLLRLGSISVAPAEERQPVITWDHVARPAEVHERLLRAIARAQSKP